MNEASEYDVTQNTGDCGEFDAPIAEWTLFELEHSADLGSVRSAWSRDGAIERW